MAAYQGGQRSGRGKRKAPARPTESKPSDKRTNFPGGRSTPKPKPSAQYVWFGGKRVLLHQPHPSGVMVGQRQGPPVPARLTKAPPAPKLPAPTRTTVARPAAKPKPTPKPKAPAKAKPPAASATSAERRVSASTSNRESGNYGTSKTNNPLMKDMVARMKAREDKAQAAATSKLTYKPNKDSGYTPKDKVKGSKDYSSQFKDMKGGSSRFAAELKKKKAK
jgi:hypothetical protein